MSKNKRGLGTPKEVEVRLAGAFTYVMVTPVKPRLRRDTRKSALKFRNEQQAILNADSFTHRQLLNHQLAEGIIDKRQHRSLQRRKQIFRPAGVFPESSYNTPVAKKEGKMRPSIINLREQARTGSRITSEINHLARIERRRLWQIKEAEVKTLLASL